MPESADVRLARIEEGLVHLHSKLDERHDELMATLAPLADRVDTHHVKLAIYDRDRVWVVGICGVIGAVAGTVVHFMLH